MKILAALLSAALAAPGPAFAQAVVAETPAPAPLAVQVAPLEPSASLEMAPLAATAPLPSLEPLAAELPRPLARLSTALASRALLKSAAAPKALHGALRLSSRLLKAGPRKAGAELNAAFDHGARRGEAVEAPPAWPIPADPFSAAPSRFRGWAPKSTGASLPEPGRNARRPRAPASTFTRINRALAAATAALTVSLPTRAWAWREDYYSPHDGPAYGVPTTPPSSPGIIELAGAGIALLAVMAVILYAVWWAWSDNMRVLKSEELQKARGAEIGPAPRTRDAGANEEAFWPALRACLGRVKRLIMHKPTPVESLAGTIAASEMEESAPAKPKGVTFDDIAGQEEAKRELQKVVAFIKNPGKYRKLGAKGFRGVLEFGPPGTGKTELARAVANESGAEFFEASGSEFVEMYVGVGAKRVRDLFQKARDAKGPAVVFIDEIDGMGKARQGSGGGSNEYEQTLNQLLKEMDGFHKDSSVVVIATTNRPDLLDPALLRGRRFGLKLPVGLPDVNGREAILRVHARGMPLAEDVSLRKLAEQTPGSSGADLAEIANDAAMLAAERGAEQVSMADFLAAVDRFTIGHERKIILSEEERRITAYHEAGHALVSHLLPDADPVRKLTIIPNGLEALGFMQAMPEEERNIHSRERLAARIAVAMGGRVAEEMMTGRIYSGAASDLEAATKIARAMVMKLGMSAAGPIAYAMEGEPSAAGKPLSESGKRLVDDEVKRLLRQAYQLATDTLAPRRDALEKLAGELLTRETLRADDLQRLLPSRDKEKHAP